MQKSRGAIHWVADFASFCKSKPLENFTCILFLLQTVAGFTAINLDTKILRCSSVIFNTILFIQQLEQLILVFYRCCCREYIVDVDQRQTDISIFTTYV